jgi:signal transduction histidine kinase
MTAPETILLIDDESHLRMNMRASLEDLGYQVLEAPDGPEAFRISARQRPDLVLLDISMPGMDGFEVCRRLKADPDTAEIPVIFLSAFLAPSDKVAAFGCGGVDFITKPFQFEEVATRIGVHLEIHRQRRLLLNQHEALKHLEKQRDALTHMMVHDMRSPLTSLMLSMDLALEMLPPQASSERARLECARACAERIHGMVNGVLELNRLEAGGMPLFQSRFDLARLAREAAGSPSPVRGRRRLWVSGPASLQAWSDPEIVWRVITNLIENACKFTADGGNVEVRLGSTGACARVEVIDDGPGIPPGQQQIIFDKFSQALPEFRSNGFGLGLAFCKLAVESQGGEIGVTSEPGQGSAFWFTLPQVQA